MTYGWSILIIAIVLAALFQLGVFNSTNFAPKAQPGACQVFRPNGPETTSFINTEGVCNGELPQYVAQFNGASSSIIMGTVGLPTGSSARSAFAWIYMRSYASPIYAIFSYGTGTSEQLSELGISCSDNVYLGGFDDDACSTFAPTIGAWYFVGYTYAAGSTSPTLYMDGQSQNIPLNGGLPLNTVISFSAIGSRGYGGYFFNGLISNVQIYNTSLSGPEVNALYLEGIGGAPIDLQNLVGWWPLNGNANDYSGNGNDGVANGAVTYTGNWYGGYTPP